MNIEKLSDHFNPVDIEWRIQSCGWKNGGEPWAMVLAYVTNRAIMNRLDEVCGPMNWQNHFSVEPDGAIACGISIWRPAWASSGHEESCEQWITKWDAAEPTEVEAVKGGRSSAMKRAAVHWGIGRYLYNLDTTFAVCQMERPPAQEKPLWHKHYDKKEQRAFFWKNPDLPKWALPQNREAA